MAATKIIYGKGRAPRPSEFTADQFVINSDDSRVFGKNKSNELFEVATTKGGAFFASTTFISGSEDFKLSPTPSNTNMNIKAGTGISFVSSSGNEITIQATGQSVAINAFTASYVAAGNIDGGININTQTNLQGGQGLSLIGNQMTANVGNGLEIVNDNIIVQDIFLKNNADDVSSHTITAANIHTNGIVKLAPQGDIAAIAGGMYYSNNNNFYLGFS